MNGKHILIGALTTLSLLGAGTSVAAGQTPSAHGEAKPLAGKADGKMSCSDMMEKMGSNMPGKGMMGSMMSRGSMMPDLPPGNEKLNAQMHAEMMQAMGAIMQKYAERMPTSTGK